MSKMHVMINAVIFAFSLLLTLVVRVDALPVEPRDAVSPPITSPTAGTVWHVGELVTVTWDTSDLPPLQNITNPKGKVILGFETADSLNLDIATPLAQDFSILDGSVSFVVPDVPSRTNYIIVLMGSSGNSSPQFTLEGGPGETTSIAPSQISSVASVTSDPATSSLVSVSSGTASTPAQGPTSAASPSSAPPSTAAPSVTAAPPSITPGSASSSLVTDTPVTTLTVPSIPFSSSETPESTSTSAPNQSLPDNNDNNESAAWSSKHVHISSVIFAATAAFVLL